MISVCKDLVSANDFLETFFVITEPAPTILVEQSGKQTLEEIMKIPQEDWTMA